MISRPFTFLPFLSLVSFPMHQLPALGKYRMKRKPTTIYKHLSQYFCEPLSGSLIIKKRFQNYLFHIHSIPFSSSSDKSNALYLYRKLSFKSIFYIYSLIKAIFFTVFMALQLFMSSIFLTTLGSSLASLSSLID